VRAGGYAIARSAAAPRITLAGVGAVMPELCEAAADLERDGVPCDVLCLTSPDLLFRAVQARRGLAGGAADVLDDLFPAERAAPLVTVLDGHPHTLAFLAGVRCVPATHLGVDDFGQSGDVDDLYRDFGLDADPIAGAAADLLA
jgi:pyruvate dehydrogenase E1 component